MSDHSDARRLNDINTAIAAIREHLTRGSLSDGLIFDAVRMRFVEIGEATKAISPDLLRTEPGIPWAEIARMRDRLAHRYFDTNHSILQSTVDNDLDVLAVAVQRLQAILSRST